MADRAAATRGTVVVGLDERVEDRAVILLESVGAAT
jgi:hypothetical protein